MHFAVSVCAHLHNHRLPLREKAVKLDHPPKRPEVHVRLYLAREQPHLQAEVACTSPSTSVIFSRSRNKKLEMPVNIG